MKWFAPIALSLAILCQAAAPEGVEFTLFRYSPIRDAHRAQYDKKAQDWVFALAEHARGKQKLSRAERLRIMEKLLPNWSDIRSLVSDGYKDTMREILKKRLDDCIRGFKRFKARDAEYVADLIAKEYLW
jgi:hypothetical protein